MAGFAVRLVFGQPHNRREAPSSTRNAYKLVLS